MKKLFAFLITTLIGFVGNAQIVNIPDVSFKQVLLSASSSNYIAKNLAGSYAKVDTNNDGLIQQTEALQVSYLEVNASSIDDLTGIEYFTNLRTLYCNGNYLTSLNINGLTNLTRLGCANNDLTSLNLNGLTNLQFLECTLNAIPSLNLTALINLQFLLCGSNSLSNIDVSTLINLKRFDCSQNQLTGLNVTSLINLQELYCSHNQIPSLDISGLTNLNVLDCSNNLLPSLNVSGLTHIYQLNSSGNLLSSLDVSELSNLNYLSCSNNHLTTLFIKNGHTETTLVFSSNPNLHYICADDNQISLVQNLLTSYGYTTCQVNSYCSFVPGGTFYTIQGNNRYDENADGCTPADINYPNLKLSFTDGTNSGSLIPNTSGAYRFDVQAGAQTFNPTLENPTYFNISPTTATVTFPTTASPYIQDFCITANGMHNDLEVTLLPIGNARSGFDTQYKIIYKNKGTNTQSGTVNLTFNDAVLDYVSAIPAVDSQTVNNLTWIFSNLVPFETRVIDITLSLNSPIETPPVNSGDILNYTATVIGLTDETSVDNTSILNQTVVNALDPNNKTCIDGTIVSPSIVGQYVHYIVRFQNDGTANAQNIVVKDVIDTTEFDVTTLVPLSGSASYETRIKNTNQVEFIFQNINLPFAAGTNTGYVAFKIKTKPTLVVGNTFSNSASIFFDYNAPIVTNTATTTITALATQDFDFGTYFSVYPNPAKQVLNLETKAEIGVKSINIYNLLGQMVIAIPNAESVSTIDVTDLKIGTYFIKVNTDKGTANAKFVKE